VSASEPYEVRTLSAPLDATVELPGSKSFTNRALLIAAMAEGRSTIRQALFSDDSLDMARALCALGIPVRRSPESHEFVVDGRAGAIPVEDCTLDVGNAGTAARFLAAFTAVGRGRYVLDGSARMRERPIQPLLDALVLLGAGARSLAGNGCPPVEILADGLSGGRTRVDASQSSQYLSALMLVGPVLRDGLIVDVDGDVPSRPFVDLTASSMRAFGADVTVTADCRRVTVAAGQRYCARDYTVEPDATAASYFFAAAAITGGRVRVPGLGRGSAQGDLGFVDVLRQMGCATHLGEDYAEVIGPAGDGLRGADVDLRGISDTFLTLAAIAPFAREPVRIRGVGHTRAQESDRVAAAVKELRRLGAAVDEAPDGLTIYPSEERLHGADVETYGDHRVAMSFSLVGLRVPGVRIVDPGCTAKTFPEYFSILDRVTAPA
jgi:3-phosphoshikimate 1-carboxyvinyltransferase